MTAAAFLTARGWRVFRQTDVLVSVWMPAHGGRVHLALRRVGVEALARDLGWEG